jgi:hypothetical protein
MIMTTTRVPKPGSINDTLSDRYACLICGDQVWDGGAREPADPTPPADFALVHGELKVQPIGVYFTLCESCLSGEFDPSVNADYPPPGEETLQALNAQMRRVVRALWEENLREQFRDLNATYFQEGETNDN